MENSNNLNRLFYFQFHDYMYEQGFVFVKKYNIFMKCINKLLLQYIFPERLFSYTKGNVCFAIAGSIRSVYSDSFEKKNLITETIRNNNCLCKKGEVDAKSDFEYNDENAESVMKMAFEEAKMGILSLFDEVTEINQYFDYCKYINPLQIFGATSFRGDSLSLIVYNDKDDMIDVLSKTLERLGIDKHNEKLYKLYYSSLVEDIAGERDKVFNNPELYACAMKEAERRKTANLEILKQNGLL
ncbi:MAG: hypothetical protein IKW90_00610 [Lachnospiraceae bacterium]|nr:hypothetical protein [Lachnospiraceae bacterium]